MHCIQNCHHLIEVQHLFWPSIHPSILLSIHSSILCSLLLIPPDYSSWGEVVAISAVRGNFGEVTVHCTGHIVFVTHDLV